jgi:hypothetical protein
MKKTYNTQASFGNFLQEQDGQDVIKYPAIVQERKLSGDELKILKELSDSYRKRLIGPILENTEIEFCRKYVKVRSDFVCLGQLPTLNDLIFKYGI